MNPRTGLPLAWVVFVSPEQGEGWEKGVILADAGKLALTFPSFQGRILTERLPWVSSTPSSPLCIDNDVNKNGSKTQKSCSCILQIDMLLKSPCRLMWTEGNQICQCHNYRRTWIPRARLHRAAVAEVGIGKEELCKFPITFCCPFGNKIMSLLAGSEQAPQLRCSAVLLSWTNTAAHCHPWYFIL